MTGRRPVPPEVRDVWPLNAVLPHLYPNRIPAQDVEQDSREAGYAQWWTRSQVVADQGMPVAVHRTDDDEAPISGTIEGGMVVRISPSRHILATGLPPSGWEVRPETDRYLGQCVGADVSGYGGRQKPILPSATAVAQPVTLDGDQMPNTQAVSSGGSGYDWSNASGFRPFGAVVGDGVGATVSALAINSSGTITSVSFGLKGEGYTWAVVLFLLPPMPRSRWLPSDITPSVFDVPKAVYRIHEPDGYAYTDHWLPWVGADYARVMQNITPRGWRMNDVPSAISITESRGAGVAEQDPQVLVHCPNSWGVQRWTSEDGEFNDFAAGDWSYQPAAGEQPLWRVHWTSIGGFGSQSLFGWRYNTEPSLYVDGDKSKGIRAVFTAEISGGVVIGFDRIRQGLGYAGTEGVTIDTDGTGLDISLDFNNDEPNAGYIEGITINDGGSGASFVTLTIDLPTQTPQPSAWRVRLTGPTGTFTGPELGTPASPEVTEDIFLDDGSDSYFDTSFPAAAETGLAGVLWWIEIDDDDGIGTGADELYNWPNSLAEAQAREDGAAPTTYPSSLPFPYYLYKDIPPPEQEDIFFVDANGPTFTLLWAVSAWTASRQLGDGSRLHRINLEADADWPTDTLFDTVVRSRLPCVWVEAWRPPSPLPFTAPGPAGIAWGALPA
jgi:hypothetical protein